MDQIDLKNRFEHHPPRDEKTKELHAAVRGMCTHLAFSLDALIPDGREKSLVVTKIEEAMSWANAAIARRPPLDAPPERSLRIDHGPVLVDDKDGATRVFSSEDAAKAQAQADGWEIARCRPLTYGAQIND
jgi:hypothetical protein